MTDSALNFVDPDNPTADEVRRWAYTPDADFPHEEWDLVVSLCPYDDVFLECAADVDCPGQRCMLGVLYVIVGDSIRSNFYMRDRSSIESLIAKADGHSSCAISRWQQRSRDLLKNPDSFDYDL